MMNKSLGGGMLKVVPQRSSLISRGSIFEQHSNLAVDDQKSKKSSIFSTLKSAQQASPHIFKVPERKHNYKIINELSEGAYFGEVALMTNLRRTSSVISVSLTVCGVISKAELEDQLDSNQDFRLRMEARLENYRDAYFKFLVTMVRNVFCFRAINSVVLRQFVYNFHEKWYNKGHIVLRTGEYSGTIFFIKKGKVQVMVRDKEITAMINSGKEIP